MPSMMWFRADLRVHDNPALYEACKGGDGVIAVFLIAGTQWAEHDWGDVRVTFLHQTLDALKATLDDMGIPLLIEWAGDFADAPATLLRLARSHDVDTLYFNREFEINERERDDAVTEAFEDEGIGVETFNDQTIMAPGGVRTQAGDYYTVFTPFKKSWIKAVNDDVDLSVLRKPTVTNPVKSVSSHDLPQRIKGFSIVEDRSEWWPAGEEVARKRLRAFVKKHADDYDDDRDFPALDDGTSRLSPYLAVGAISIRQCLVAARDANNGRLSGGKKGLDTWISELIWREFYRHIMVGFPRVCRHRAFRREYDKLSWRDDDKAFEAWTKGQTGIPIIDAGMRQLAEIGWMHNRVRMIVAMFLSKNLLIDWRRGEKFFMENLIDGDLASNNGGWQWASSTGTDAVPYFRMFNPFSQSKRYDADGEYIRRYVPELDDVDASALHDPEKFPPMARSSVGYPEPIVDVSKTRERALKAFKALS